MPVQATATLKHVVLAGLLPFEHVVFTTVTLPSAVGSPEVQLWAGMGRVVVVAETRNAADKRGVPRNMPASIPEAAPVAPLWILGHFSKRLVENRFSEAREGATLPPTENDPWPRSTLLSP